MYCVIGMLQSVARSLFLAHGPLFGDLIMSATSLPSSSFFPPTTVHARLWSYNVVSKAIKSDTPNGINITQTHCGRNNTGRSTAQGLAIWPLSWTLTV